VNDRHRFALLLGMALVFLPNRGTPLVSHVRGRISRFRNSTGARIAIPTTQTMIRIFMQLQIRLLGDDDLADPVMLIDNWEAARWTSSVPYPYTEADGRTWIALVQQDHTAGLRALPLH
jgi:hypothetical protein